MRKKIGYLLGVLLSTLAAVIVAAGLIVYLQARFVKCFMSLGCTDNTPDIVAFLAALGAYLLMAAALAVFAGRLFKARAGVAFLLNVAPLVAVFALLVLRAQYDEYAHRLERDRTIQTAIDDAPAVHLGEPYVIKADDPNGGVTLYLHVPFEVARTVQAWSLNVLAASNDSDPHIRYSSNPNCNSGFPVPPYVFHIVDREYDKPPLPTYLSGPKVVSGQLQPGKQYYLLREIHFSYSLCRISDYQDFDPKQLKVTLNVPAARQRLGQ
jgi:hypothetical protein